MYVFIYICIYIYICRQQLFRSLRAHQYSSDQKKIWKDQSAQTTASVVSVAYRLWLPFLINGVLNLTKLRSVKPNKENIYKTNKYIEMHVEKYFFGIIKEYI